ncbi:HNH endonuclease [Vagococcus fessus]|uniref:HNH nuclease domain-containing protein n=1 Tax=Vagococcus fessus TaxID=120370 RepID=A0A430ACG7_9ENTE|nr:hypothetical protein [Vagococcus fessus]RSU04911.1 hypothetical protein CBF31_02500 [Vagococcus fessus]
MEKIKYSQEIEQRHVTYFEENIVPKIEQLYEVENYIFKKTYTVKKIYTDKKTYSAKKRYNFKKNGLNDHRRFIYYCLKNYKLLAIGNVNGTYLSNESNIKKKHENAFKKYRIEEKKTLKKFYDYAEENYKAVIDRIEDDTEYKNLFEKAFGYSSFTTGSLFEFIKQSVVKKGGRVSEDRIEKIIDQYIKLFSPKFAKDELEDFTESMCEIKEEYKKVSGDSAEIKRLFLEREKKWNLYIDLLNYNGEILKNVWNPYALVLESGVKTCFYCNRHYITPLLSSDGRFRATLDHFLPKSKYPYFSMTLYNLVPSCTVCNSSLKGSKEFDFEDINPLEINLDSCFNFILELGISKNHQVELSIDKHFLGKNKKKEKSMDKMLKLFKIKEQYNLHQRDIEKILLKKYVYNENYLKDLEKKLKDKIENLDKVQSLNDEPLSKFKKDIEKGFSDSEEFKKIEEYLMR